MPLRIIFAGTPLFAEKNLASLYHSHHPIVAVYTQPDKPVGRGQKVTMSPVKTLALAHHTPVYQPRTLRDETALETFLNIKADVMVVAAYGLILPEAVLNHPRLGCINIHASLLPRWRGASPIQQAILAGDAETGITIMQMDKGLDTGDMLLKQSVPITPFDTAGTLHDKLASVGSALIVDALDKLEQGALVPLKQDNALATYAPKIEKEAAIIDWTLSANQLLRFVHAYNPWPVAWTFYQDSLIKIYEANVVESYEKEKPGTIVAKTKKSFWVSTGEGCLEITKIQFPGKKILPVADIFNAKPAWFNVGSLFTPHVK